MRDYTYRAVYKSHYGAIPKDETGRSYDIHHKDGDHTNNDPDNLIAIPIQEHYDLHFALEDWHACILIGLRMQKSPLEISRLSSLAAQRRTKEGTHPWQSESYKTSVKNRIASEVSAGTYHMLGGLIQKEFQLKRATAGIHQWRGPNHNLEKLANGTHSSQKEFTCPHCGTQGKGSTNAKRWHFDNCRSKLNVR